MKLYFFVFIFIFLTNLGFSQSELDSIRNNQIIVVINDKEMNMKIDTGASISVINNTSKIGGVSYYSKLKQKIQSLRLPTKTVEEKFYEIPMIKSELGVANHLNVLIKENANQLSCDTNKVDADGTIGLDYIGTASKNGKIFLNYQTNTISILKGDSLDGFKLVDSKFKDGLIFINLEINGKKQEVLFDSGSEEFLILTKGKFSKKEYDFKEVESPLLDANTGYIPNKTTYYQGVPINLAGFVTDKTVISTNQNLFTSILGLPFIKNFNWIIDFENESLYVQQHSENFDNSWLEELKDINELVLAINDNLVVIYSNSGLKIGSIVKSVNNIKITKSNLCKYQNLLLKNNSDWSSFDLKFKKS